jgi:hypothetical protein
MSELLQDARRRKELLKHMILQLHEGHAPAEVRAQLQRVLGRVPYNDVVEVEQELIRDGLPTAEILKLCDLHSAAMRGALEAPTRAAPAGHPVHTFQQENRALGVELDGLRALRAEVEAAADEADASDALAAIRVRCNALMDVDKHYLRKEHLLFPFLEKRGITGPPTVMWGKHDEARALLKGAQEALASTPTVTAGEVKALFSLALEPASAAVAEMIDKEEMILLPMCLDNLTDVEWLEIARQSVEIGFCLYDPVETWAPAVASAAAAATGADAAPADAAPVDAAPADAAPAAPPGRVQLPSGSFTPAELQAVLNTIPFDLTFVDRDDTVRYFTQGRERIFARNRAILGRKVQYCHPPKSVDVVERILDAFRAGRQDQARFWIELGGKFVCIEYFALRGERGEYLGCLEVSQNLTEKRALQGQQRLLSWTDAPAGPARPEVAHG